MPEMEGRQSPHRWNQVRRLPLLPSIQTIEQYEQAILLGTRDALAYLRGIEPLLQLTVADIRHVHREIFKSVHPYHDSVQGIGRLRMKTLDICNLEALMVVEQ